MRSSLIVIILLLFSVQGYAQYCVDSTRTPDDYIPCGTDYEPVCGCNNVTYRNGCSAYYWGGLYSQSWVDGPCETFDFDFYPTAITNFPVHFSAYRKAPGSVTLYVYDSMGTLCYSDFFYVSVPFSIITKEIPLENLLRGIYIAYIVSDGEVKYLKFAKQGLD